jgi:hypothetical protein
MRVLFVNFLLNVLNISLEPAIKILDAGPAIKEIAMKCIVCGCDRPVEDEREQEELTTCEIHARKCEVVGCHEPVGAGREAARMKTCCWHKDQGPVPLSDSGFAGNVTSPKTPITKRKGWHADHKGFINDSEY